jgi:hypothetical protein
MRSDLFQQDIRGKINPRPSPSIEMRYGRPDRIPELPLPAPCCKVLLVTEQTLVVEETHHGDLIDPEASVSKCVTYRTRCCYYAPKVVLINTSPVGERINTD